MGQHPAHDLATAAEGAARELRSWADPGGWQQPGELADADFAALLPRIQGALAELAGCLDAIGSATTSDSAAGRLTATASQLRQSAGRIPAIRAEIAEAARIQEAIRAGRAAEQASALGADHAVNPERSHRPDLAARAGDHAAYLAWARDEGAATVLESAGLPAGPGDPAAPAALDAYCDAYAFCAGLPSRADAAPPGARYLKGQRVVTARGAVGHATGKAGPGGGPEIDDGNGPAAYPRAAVPGPLAHVLNGESDLRAVTHIISGTSQRHRFADGDVLLTAGSGDARIITGPVTRLAADVQAGNAGRFSDGGRYDASVRLAAQATAASGFPAGARRAARRGRPARTAAGSPAARPGRGPAVSWARLRRRLLTFPARRGASRCGAQLTTRQLIIESHMIDMVGAQCPSPAGGGRSL